MAPPVDSTASTRSALARHGVTTPRATAAVAAPDVGDQSEPGGARADGTCDPVRLLEGVEAIVFEPAGVLYDATLWWRWLLPLVARSHPACPIERFEQRWQDEYLPAVQTGRRELAEALEAWLAACGCPRRQIDELTGAAISRRRDLELEVRPLPGVTAVLKRLRETGFRLALSCDSTSPREELARRLARYQLEQAFETVVPSIELGRTKSDLLAFHVIESKLSLAGERLLFAGCRASDLAGAACCGWTTLLVGPANSPGPWPRPHARITRLPDLLRGARSVGSRTSS